MRSADPLMAVPPGAQVDVTCPVNWSHPLARGLAGFFLTSAAPSGWSGNPTTLYDAVRGGACPHDGTINGGLKWGWAASDMGGCLTGYAGGEPTATYVDCGNSAALNPTGSFTLAVWGWGDPSASGTLWILGRDDNTLGRSYVYGVNWSTAQITAQINGSVVLGGGLTTVTREVWHLLAMSGDSVNGFAGYIDGALSNTGVWAAPAATTGSTTIGKRTFSGFNAGWVGRIGDTLIYNGRALSAPEHAQLFAISQQGYPGLLNYTGLWGEASIGLGPAPPASKRHCLPLLGAGR